MLFNSLTYVLFLAVIVTLYWATPQRHRMPLLLAGSFVFYCSWRWEYGLLLLFSIVTNFHLARAIHDRRSRGLVAGAVGLNLAILGYFKYLGFFADSLNDLTAFVGGGRPVPVLDLVLPLGISFFTFQAMSYVVDVARGKREPERQLLPFALYISFWPQLVAGPIVRSHEIIPQFRTRQRFSYDDVSEGLKRVLYGLFLKVVLADSIAPFVDEGFSKATFAQNSALDNWTLAFAFGFQIYFDFAGYSSIAIGSARLMGFRLPENFDFPYVSASPREFWRRWHITLSSWIRDYLYVPLQGIVPTWSLSSGGLAVGAGEGRSAASASRRNTALVLTWALMGLWHGAAWTFVLWGLWHAALVLVYRGWSRAGPRLAAAVAAHPHPLATRLLGIAFTLPAAMAGWIFFRAQSVPQALVMLATFVDPQAYWELTYKENLYLLTFLYTIAVFAAFGLRGALHGGWAGAAERYAWAPRAVVYTALVLLVAGFLRGQQQFIYFQF